LQYREEECIGSKKVSSYQCFLTITKHNTVKKFSWIEFGMKTGEVIWESENKVSQQFWMTLSMEIRGRRGILMKRKDYLSREDRTRALTNIGLVKRKLMK
jgi:hypothetical protein